MLYDSEDTPLRAMQVLSDGGILLGTAGEGLILKIEPDGRPRTLYTAPHPEVVAFAADPSGTSYAALLASEASLVDLNRQSAAQDSTAEDQDEADQSASTSEPAGQVTITVGPEGAASPVGSRPPGFGGARSEIVRISQQGVVETVTKFKEETIYTLEWQRDRLWVGTGLEGKVYSLKDQRPVLEADVDERQIVRLLEDAPGPAFATTNASALYRFSGGTARTGVYTSPALDSEQIARFGTLRWQGEVPSGSEISFSFRSGMSSDPDRTWTDWSPPESSREISLGGLASGRFVQWRADFQTTNESSPTLTEATVSYLQANLPPSIDSFKVLDPGQVLVPTNFNPNQLVFEPASPNRQGIFTTLEPAKLPEGQRLKTLWKKGYRTLQWKAEDPNKDDMRYEVSFRPESSISEWMSVAEDLRATHYSFDATSLPDGRYRFHLRAFDRPRDDDADLKTSEEISEPIVVDHSIPVLIDATVHDGEVWVQVYDQWNPIREAEYSADAGEWRPAAAQDGLLDAQRETLVMPLTENGHLMLLRVIDAAFNVVTFDISREIQ